MGDLGVRVWVLARAWRLGVGCADNLRVRSKARRKLWTCVEVASIACSQSLRLFDRCFCGGIEREECDFAVHTTLTSIRSWFSC